MEQKQNREKVYHALFQIAMKKTLIFWKENKPILHSLSAHQRSCISTSESFAQSVIVVKH